MIGVRIVRHFLQLFLLPMVGIVLAWFGPTIIEHLGASLTPIHVLAGVVVAVAVLVASISRSESPALIGMLTVGSLMVIGGIPVYLLYHLADLSQLGNLLDLAGLGAFILFVALATLPFRIRAPQTQPVSKPRRSIPDEIRRADEKIGDGFGYPGMDSSGAYQLWLRSMKSKGLR